MKENQLLNWHHDNGRIKLDFDWFDVGLPENVKLHESSYIDSSYGFAMFCSDAAPAFQIGKASGCYDKATFFGSGEAKISIGEFTIIQGSFFYCHDSISIGDHCMISWSAVLLDGWVDGNVTLNDRRQLLQAAAVDQNRALQITISPAPITVGNNVWIGFGSVIMPGVKIGRGSIIGCKSFIEEDVPEYAVVKGSPATIIRYLNPDDTVSKREEAMRECLA